MPGNESISHHGGTMIDERTFSTDHPPIHFCGIELSNKFLLRVTAVSFLLFVVAEIIGALASNSLSLLGDAGAMSVDVFTVRIHPFSDYSINSITSALLLLSIFVICIPNMLNPHEAKLMLRLDLFLRSEFPLSQL